MKIYVVNIRRSIPPGTYGYRFLQGGTMIFANENQAEPIYRVKLDGSTQKVIPQIETFAKDAISYLTSGKETSEIHPSRRVVWQKGSFEVNVYFTSSKTISEKEVARFCDLI